MIRMDCSLSGIHRDLTGSNLFSAVAARSDSKRALFVPKNTGRRGLYKTALQWRSCFCRGRPYLGRALSASLLPCKCGRVRISCCVNPDHEHSANFIAPASQFAWETRGFVRAGRRTRERTETRGEGRGAFRPREPRAVFLGRLELPPDSDWPRGSSR